MGLRDTTCLQVTDNTLWVIESMFNGFHDLICLLTYSQTQAAVVSILAELVVDTINAADLITLIHSVENSNNQMQCASYENIQRNIMICMAVFAVVNIKEMKKAFSIIQAVKTKYWVQTQTTQFDKIANQMDAMTQGLLSKVSAVFGTSTRMAGTVSSVSLPISSALGAMAAQPCMEVPWWGWLAASMGGLGLAPYKYHFLVGTSWSKCMVNFWTAIYALSKNMPLFAGRIAAIILKGVQHRTEEDDDGTGIDIHEQIFWGVMTVLGVGVFIPAQIGLNKKAVTDLVINRDTASPDSLISTRENTPLLWRNISPEAIEQYTRFKRIRNMVLASAGSAGLTALAISQAPESLARHGDFNTPREPVAIDERVVLFLSIFGGMAFFLYYYCRLYLGLSNL